jgi:hypothetical protein
MLKTAAAAARYIGGKMNSINCQNLWSWCTKMQTASQSAAQTGKKYVRRSRLRSDFVLLGINLQTLVTRVYSFSIE